MPTQFSLDALPYVDKQIDEPGARYIVDKMIAAEMKKMPKPRDPASLFPDIDLFKDNELMQQELDRVRRGKPMEQLDLARYQLHAPTSTDSTSTSAPSIDANGSPLSAQPSASEELPEGRAQWTQALENANAQLEHQNQRILNLELVQKFGNNQLEYDLSRLRKQVDDKRTEVMELNKLRKRDQLDVAESLHRLETKWGELISSTIQVEMASATMEQELEQLKQYEIKLCKELGVPLPGTEQ
ncbi:hypothetical protein BGZ92_009282 [Podila epicladia]|nr:hypothetical protein BGZ92_009282 [Podila epicladia]